MSKKLNKKKLALVISICIVVIGSIATTVKVGFSYTKNKEQIRNENLSGKTITEIVQNTSQEINKGPNKSYGKVAYITIDDGPSRYTDELIKILKYKK